MIVLYIIICILTFFIGFLLGRKHNITIHNEDDIKKGMELERRNKQFKEYLNSNPYVIHPRSYVEGRYKEIKKEVLGHY